MTSALAVGLGCLFASIFVLAALALTALFRSSRIKRITRSVERYGCAAPARSSGNRPAGQEESRARSV